MNRPGFLAGAVVAFVLAVAGSLLFAAAVSVVSPLTALRLLVSVLGFAYLVWLLRRCRRKTGRVTAAAAWIGISVAAWFFVPSLPQSLIVHAVALWLLRSVLVYRSALPALADLAITTASVSATAWAATRSGSVFLAAWSFFLVQALVAGIPSRVPRPRRDKRRSAAGEDAFEAARRRAEAAFRQLIARAGR